MPSGLFVTVSWVSFVIPADSIPGRIALIITTLLVLVNIANPIFSISPAATKINSIQSWILVCIFFVFVTVVEYAFVLCMSRHFRRRRIKKTLGGVDALVAQVAHSLAAPQTDIRPTSRRINVNGISKTADAVEANSSPSPQSRPRSADEDEEGEAQRAARLEMLIINVDYSFIAITVSVFLLFNVVYWCDHRDIFQ